MPKKTTHARSGAQRGRTKQKSFELVRPDSNKNALKTIERDEEAEVVASDVVDMEEVEEESVQEEAPAAPISVNKGPRNAATRATASDSDDKASGGAAGRAAATVTTDNEPRSAAARLAARRQAAQKAQRTPVSLISAEHYGYVRKDLIFILILAIIMFSAIIIMHFVPAIGG